MTDLEKFTKAMDGEWVVHGYEVSDDMSRLTVHYRSLLFPFMVWSHDPLSFDMTPPVGTVGWIGFIPRQHYEHMIDDPKVTE